MGTKKRILLFLTILFLLRITPIITGEGLYYKGYGGNQVVSGSLHLITLDGDKVILDAGSFFGSDGQKAPPLTKEILQDVQGIFISHAHTDHMGRLIELVNMGYTGPIYCSLPTKELLGIMLTMAARYGDLGEEAFYFSLSSYERNERTGTMTAAHLNPTCPFGRNIHHHNIHVFTSKRTNLQYLDFFLCSKCIELEVMDVMGYVEVLPLYEPFPMTPNITITTYLTPHIPGSVMVLLEGRISGLSLLYTGDFGSGLSPFLPPQDLVEEAHWVLLEGTYGPSTSLPLPEDRTLFIERLDQYLQKGKRVIIPAFVLDRTQQILHSLDQGQKKGLLGEYPILVLGSSVSKINQLYSKAFLQEEFHQYFSHSFREEGPFTLGFYKELPYLSGLEKGELIITSPGMADSGYSKELIKLYGGDRDTVFIFPGYLSLDTLGGRLLELKKEGGGELMIDREIIPIKALVEQVPYYSGHGTPEQIKDFLSPIKGLKGILLVHSSLSTASSLKEYYQEAFPNLEIIIPKGGKVYQLKAY